MCLRTLLEITDEDKKVKEGYKVFIRNGQYDKYRIRSECIPCDNLEGLPKRRWLEANHETLLSVSNKAYPSGWHCFKDKEGALRWMSGGFPPPYISPRGVLVMHRVLMKDIVAVGTQCFNERHYRRDYIVFVCKKIFIMEEVKGI